MCCKVLVKIGISGYSTDISQYFQSAAGMPKFVITSTHHCNFFVIHCTCQKEHGSLVSCLYCFFCRHTNDTATFCKCCDLLVVVVEKISDNLNPESIVCVAFSYIRKLNHVGKPCQRTSKCGYIKCCKHITDTTFCCTYKDVITGNEH